jgi:bifunctional non-homologous end joining protein LigD
MAATLVHELPEGPEWLYEVKLDGYRALVMKSADRVQIRSRNNKDLTASYPGIVSAAARLRAATAVVDGEIVAVDGQGRPSFQALQNRGSFPQHTIVFYAFDLLHVDGKDITRLPLEERKARLADVVRESGVLLSASLPGTAAQVISVVRGAGLEGVIAKRRASAYKAGLRTETWVKLKLDRQQEFVVGGYRPGPRGMERFQLLEDLPSHMRREAGPHGLDALLVGFYDQGKLKFAGKVRAGFTPHVRREVFEQLKPLHTARCPFADLPNARTSHWGGGVTAEQMSEMQWLRPKLVAQVRFVEWTADDHLRHAAFLGLRDDKPAKDVRRET